MENPINKTSAHTGKKNTASGKYTPVSGSQSVRRADFSLENHKRTNVAQE